MKTTTRFEDGGGVVETGVGSRGDSTRRRFLAGLLLAVGGGVALRVLPAWRGGRRPRLDPDLARAIVAILPDRRSAAEVGRAYLRQAPADAYPGRIGAALAARSGPVEGTPWTASALRAQIRLDFERGDTVQVAGWCLARTEARICALRGQI